MYPSHLKYTKEHEWILIDGDTGIVGITDFAQQQLGDVVYVELPAIGTAVTAGQSCGIVESVKAVSELFAPVSGEVVEANDSLRDQPEQVNREQHEVWLVKIRMRDPGEASALLDADAYSTLVSA